MARRARLHRATSGAGPRSCGRPLERVCRSAEIQHALASQRIDEPGETDHPVIARACCGGRRRQRQLASSLEVEGGEAPFGSQPLDGGGEGRDVVSCSSEEPGGHCIACAEVPVAGRRRADLAAQQRRDAPTPQLELAESFSPVGRRDGVTARCGRVVVGDRSLGGAAVRFGPLTLPDAVAVVVSFQGEVERRDGRAPRTHGRRSIRSDQPDALTLCRRSERTCGSEVCGDADSARFDALEGLDRLGGTDVVRPAVPRIALTRHRGLQEGVSEPVALHGELDQPVRCGLGQATVHLLGGRPSIAASSSSRPGDPSTAADSRVERVAARQVSETEVDDPPQVDLAERRRRHVDQVGR